MIVYKTENAHSDNRQSIVMLIITDLHFAHCGHRLMFASPTKRLYDCCFFPVALWHMIHQTASMVDVCHATPGHVTLTGAVQSCSAEMKLSGWRNPHGC